jgi:kynurenine formamidase
MSRYNFPTLFLSCLIAILGCSKSNSFPEGEWVDLTHDFSSDTIYWPTAEPFKSQTVSEGITDKGFFYLTKNYSASEHGGTHIDAPIHFAEGKETLDEIPLSKLIGPAAVVDVSKKAIDNPDYLVGIDDFKEWEDQNGRIPDNSIVLLYTGYSKYWPDKLKYLGTEKRGEQAIKHLHFPGLDPEAAKWLIENRRLKAIGLDTASIDYGQSQLFESHVTLFKESVPAFENVANLDKLPAKGAVVFALPMKIKGGSGGPLRIVALIPHKN